MSKQAIVLFCLVEHCTERGSGVLVECYRFPLRRRSFERLRVVPLRACAFDTIDRLWIGPR